MMKLVAVLALAAVVAARPQQSYGPPARGGGGGGYQQQSGGYQGAGNGGGYQGNLLGAAQNVQESQAGMPYQFQWEVRAPEFGNDYSHQQSSDGRVTQGEYRVLLPDSRVQIVRFTADENGYVADVQYEGTAQYPQASNNVPVVAAYNQGAGNGGGYSQGGSGGYAQQRPSSNYGAPGRR